MSFSCAWGSSIATTSPTSSRSGKRLTADLLPAGFDARQVEDVVDQRQQVPAVALDHVEVAVLLLGDGALQPAVQHARQRDHRVERRAQLVAHVGEEGALEPVGLVQLPLLQSPARCSARSARRACAASSRFCASSSRFWCSSCSASSWILRNASTPFRRAVSTLQMSFTSRMAGGGVARGRWPGRSPPRPRDRRARGWSGSPAARSPRSPWRR